MSKTDLERFAKIVKEFQLSHFDKRDMPPMIKKIIGNLTCQKHKFMYCPKCKDFTDPEFDPMDNIQQFLKFVDAEQRKWNKIKKQRERKSKSKSPPENKKGQKMKSPAGKNVDEVIKSKDSISEITDLDKKDILNKYYQTVLNIKQKKERERKETRDRLYHAAEGCGRKGCRVCKRPNSARGETVKLELREVEIAKLMMDEENSAHQFSLHN